MERSDSRPNEFLPLKKSKSAGFTLMEILMVCILIVIATAIAIPHYIKYAEITRAENAVANLQSILEAEQSYYLDYGNYYTSSNIDSINSNLGLNIEAVDFTYSISNGGNSFTAEAKRKGKSRKIILRLDSNGDKNFTASGWPWQLPIKELSNSS